MIQDESDLVSLEEIYEKRCKNLNVEPEDVLIYYRDEFNTELNRQHVQLRKGNVEILNLRVDLLQKISRDVVQDVVMDTYVKSFVLSSDEFWIFRKTFTRQYACSIFLTYVMALGHRYPHKISLSKSRGTVINTEILPTLNPNGQITLVEAVPFRLTPNLQKLVSPLYVEGLLAPAIHSCAEVYYKPDSELSEYLPMIVRDELISWVLLNQPGKTRLIIDQEGRNIGFKHDLEILEELNIDERQFLGRVIQNCELAMKRCQTLACLRETEKTSELKSSALQTILDLISCATNPQKLALMDAHWQPWL